MTSTPVSITKKFSKKKKSGGSGKSSTAVLKEEEYYQGKRQKKIMGKFNQNISYTCMKCHNEIIISN